jgi:hypothetical protein
LVNGELNVDGIDDAVVLVEKEKEEEEGGEAEERGEGRGGV